MRRRVVASILLLACAPAACAGDEKRAHGWSVQEAEAVTTVRGLPVRVLACRGLGKRVGIGDIARYRRFACVAGARRPGEAYDTVAVHYTIRVVHPRDYVLESARFYGGPGIP